MMHDEKTCGIWMSPGKHGRLIREKYFSRGEPCPVTISLGHDPLLFMAANHEIDYGTDEFAYAGGHRGRAYEVVNSELQEMLKPRGHRSLKPNRRRMCCDRFERPRPLTLRRSACVSGLGWV